ncbi:ESPR-type extended signal peptide-containing protein, partial [Mannheimia sp. HC-2023]|uniref:collagen-flanked surface repeat-containing protein n=1 Tax=Mannheimia indoligenes TaxID=3103145 RepID=UPI002FE521EE
MNKIFKVIFNRTTQRMEVASELAKNQGKVSSTITSVEPSSSLGKTLKLSLLATVVGLVLSNSTSATVPVAQSGWSAGDYSTVILGETTDNSGPEGGARAYSGTNTYANVTAPNHHSVAIGGNTSIQSTAAAVVLGYGAKVEQGTGTEKTGSVALGAYSIAGTSNTGTESQRVTIGGVTYEFAGKATSDTSVLSVGSGQAVNAFVEGNRTSTRNGTSSYWVDNKASTDRYTYRQIQNVAAGTISSSSTDAINGSQLYSVIAAVNAIANKVTTPAVIENYLHVNDGNNIGGNPATNLAGADKSGGATAIGAVAIGISTQATTQQATAVGSSAKATGSSSSAFGNGATASGEHSIAIGRNATSLLRNTVALGSASAANADNATALGAEARALHSRSVALGSGSETGEIGDAKTANVNGLTYSGFAGTNPTSTVSVGKANSERQIQNVAAGRISQTSTDAINGSQLYQIVRSGAWEVQTNNTKLSDVNWGDKVNFTSSDGSVVINGTPESTSTGDKVTTIDLKVKPASSDGSFVVSNNGTKKDDVKNNDKVNFIDGGNTKAVVTTKDNGTTNDVTYHVTGLPVQYTDKQGNPVVKVGNKYYKVGPDGNPTTQEVAAADLVINAVNPTATPNVIGAPTSITNVASGLVTNIAAGNTTLLNLNNSAVKDSTVATVGDLRNMGWIVSASGNNYTEGVKNANEVKFIGENGVTVTGATDGNVRNITVKGTKVESKTNTDGSFTITITNPNGTSTTMTVRNGRDGAAGAKGDKGDAGAQGPAGPAGRDGVNGKDGTSTTAEVKDNGNGTHTIIVKNSDGTSSTTTVSNGAKGDKGETGAAGRDGKDGKDGSTAKV